MSDRPDKVEDVESFRLRAHAWLADNVPRLSADAPPWNAMNVSEHDAARARVLQRRLCDGGFAGLCFPREYGGQGLTREHQQAFTEESRAYEMPLLFNTPTLTIIAPTLLEMGTEAQKRRHLPAMIRGDELWVQFISEPSGGSDMAAAITSAKWDGRCWRLNGSKIWSSYAYFSDYAICLARTDWDQIKHRGLTMFIVKIHQPGIAVNRIRQSDGAMEFCQEFFDDVPLPPDSVIGEVNDGWTVAQRLLIHERSSTGGSSPYASGTAGRRRETIDDLIELARRTETAHEKRTQELLADAFVLQTVHAQLTERVIAGIGSEALPDQAGALLRLFGGTFAVRRANIGVEIAGTGAVTWEPGAEHTAAFGTGYVFRQASCLGGGSTEMQRNIISERLLGMPREPAADRGVPFREARRTA
jgi:alkylation response protein AidB-like acyl-CoA dehydrogenase